MKSKWNDQLRPRVQALLQTFVGTHNFHNYAYRVDPGVESSKRYIMEFTVSEVFDADGVQMVGFEIVGNILVALFPCVYLSRVCPNVKAATETIPFLCSSCLASLYIYSRAEFHASPNQKDDRNFGMCDRRHLS